MEAQKRGTLVFSWPGEKAAPNSCCSAIARRAKVASIVIVKSKGCSRASARGGQQDRVGFSRTTTTCDYCKKRQQGSKCTLHFFINSLKCGFLIVLINSLNILIIKWAECNKTRYYIF